MSVMVTKNETEATAGAHHDRMTAFKSKLLSSHPEKAVFGAIDVGTECYWWDYGLLSLYQKNNMLALDDTEEAASLRAYLRIPEDRAQSSELGNDVQVTNGSVVLASVVKEGEIDHTIASRVVTGKCDAHGASRTLVPVRPRSRGERRSLRTFPGVSLRPPPAFNPRPRRLSTPPDAFQLHPDRVTLKVLGTPTREEIHAMNPNYTEFKFPQIKAHPWSKVFHKRLPPEALDLISHLLAYAPETRYTGLEACCHAYFDELRDPATRLPNGGPLPPLFDFSAEELATCTPEMVRKLLPPHVAGGVGGGGVGGGGGGGGGKD